MAHKKYAYIIMSARIWGSIPHVAFCFGLRKNLKSQSPHTLLVDSTKSPGEVLGVLVESKWTPDGPHQDSTRNPTGICKESTRVQTGPVGECKLQLICPVCGSK